MITYTETAARAAKLGLAVTLRSKPSIHYRRVGLIVTHLDAEDGDNPGTRLGFWWDDMPDETVLQRQLDELIETVLFEAQAMSNCKSCGARVVWVLTKKGKRMPVDVATAESHFGTCPNASEHRKKKDAGKSST